MARRFVSVSLPPEVMDLVDRFIALNNQGYTFRPQVINAAIRRFVREEMPELLRSEAERPRRRKVSRD